MTDPIIQHLISNFSKRLEAIEKRHGYLSYLIKERYANELLIQLEMMNIITSHETIVDYLPEKRYNETHSEKCDFWFKTNQREYWMEIKTRPTNYRKPGHSKGIKNSVDSIIVDIGRLRTIDDKNTSRYCVFSFYPLYDDRYSFLRKYHLSRISEALGKEVRDPDIHLDIDGAYHDTWLVEV